MLVTDSIPQVLLTAFRKTVSANLIRDLHDPITRVRLPHHPRSYLDGSLGPVLALGIGNYRIPCVHIVHNLFFTIAPLRDLPLSK